MLQNKFYITTAIPYASQKPHIGNAYDGILADMIARYKRLKGLDVLLCTGMDEHGQKIQNSAQKAGITPQEYADDICEYTQKVWEKLNVKYDLFIRTTSDFHKESVRTMFNKLYEKGDIYKGEYQGMYCVSCELFSTESQLEDGKCPDCGRDVAATTESAYFFRLSKYQDRLISYIEQNDNFIVPESRKKEMLNNFLKPGLQDLCVSRSTFDWGIKVDFDPDHVVYVWIDALSNYITALGYHPDKLSEDFKKWWPADLHVIGKDIVRFHSIYWPAFLMALDIPLPRQILGHPWLLMGDRKMSKTDGNVLYTLDLCEKYGTDAVRYYSLSEMPYAADGVITEELLVLKYNSDLANTLGNLVSRTVTMVKKYFGGIVPQDSEPGDHDEDLKHTASVTVREYFEKMNEYRVGEALNAVLNLARRANKYIDETTPWILAKDENAKLRLGTVLYNLTEIVRILGVLLMPVMPESAQSILTQAGSPDSSFDSLGSFGALKAGTEVGESRILFARIN